MTNAPFRIPQRGLRYTRGEREQATPLSKTPRYTAHKAYLYTIFFYHPIDYLHISSISRRRSRRSGITHYYYVPSPRYMPDYIFLSCVDWSIFIEILSTHAVRSLRTKHASSFSTEEKKKRTTGKARTKGTFHQEVSRTDNSRVTGRRRHTPYR